MEGERCYQPEAERSFGDGEPPSERSDAVGMIVQDSVRRHQAECLCRWLSVAKRRSCDGDFGVQATKGLAAMFPSLAFVEASDC